SFYMGRMRPPPEPDRMLPKGALTGIAVLAFIGIIWYAYPQGAEKYTDVNVPIVTADTAPYKSAPVDPGGMEVRHQDSTVFETLDKKTTSKKPEKVTSKTETPLDKAKLKQKPQLSLEPQLKQGTAAAAAATAAAAPKMTAPKPEVIHSEVASA